MAGETSRSPSAASEPTRCKVGLALSGGGFRAAFFHVGVLARLAETGILRRVEVISAVSGGSIVAAAFYIRLKRLLEAIPDGQITDDAYCKAVASVETLLRDAVGRNIRARVFSNLTKNLCMAGPRYSRSDRIGDLYDRYLYKRAWNAPRPRKRWGAQTQIALPELVIAPCGGPAGFDPDVHNEDREAKVPILLINATSLNSGHNWRFEAVRMGEPLPRDEGLGAVLAEVDKNERLEPGYFVHRPDEQGRAFPLLPEHQRDFPLGLAVAASACVPGLFHPLAISGVYQDRRVQLVDGGVHDNQGVQGLIDRGCTGLIVSDASRQLSDDKHPSTRIPAVVGRTLGISGDRIRDEQLVNVASRPGCFALMHLRKGLAGSALRAGSSPAAAPSEREGEVACADFGVDPAVQESLSKIRTDLDSFSEVEAFSLALDGYLMSSDELERKGFHEGQAESVPPADGGSWSFGRVQPWIGAPPARYLRQLEAGERRFLRTIALLPDRVRWAIRLALGLILGVALWAGAGPASELLDGSWRRSHVLVLSAAGLVIAIGYLVAKSPPAPVRHAIDLLTAVLAIVMAPSLWLWWLLAAPGRWLGRALGRLALPESPAGATAPPPPRAAGPPSPPAGARPA